MKAKIVKRTLSLITVLALIFTLAVQGAGAIQSADVNKYPYVYVHGLFGWGADEGIDDTLLGLGIMLAHGRAEQASL